MLPFHDPAFSWDTFEGFFCDFLAAGPTLVSKDGGPVGVATTSLYGRRGDSQHGIDIRAEMSNHEVWVFQCKHYKEWGPGDTQEAISKCTYQAERKFLLVTRPVSPECREIVARHPDWLLWDSNDISREFLARLPAAEAARLLYLYFGPSWPRELLDLPGLGPLVTADAKFAPLLEEARSFHHRLDLVGRQDVLASLNDFIEAKRSRVFSLVGRGGIGKSRILREWSRNFGARHPDWTLRFVSDSPAEFGPVLDGTAKRLALVFDDAHRLDDVRRLLFPELASRKDIKLILALRPGPMDQINSELTDAGFDLTELITPVPLARLSGEQALEFVEKALGPEHAARYRMRLRDLSRDCPLIAVLAAELIKRGELTERDLADTREFQTLVFGGLLREARPVEDRFSATRVKDLLRLLAMLAPLKPDNEFLKRAADFLGPDTQPHHVHDMLDALDNVGLLMTSGAGIRVTPDLLSDHLAFTACYDKHGADTTFAGRVLTHFSPDQFPRVMQHLAEAEWRAMSDHESAGSIVEPLWKWFAARFEAGDFHERRRLLDQWANIAAFQPGRTLELAQLALRLDGANATQPLSHLFSHADVLDRLPSLLKPVAEHHADKTGACLDILWKLGRDKASPTHANQNHPIKVIGEIAKYRAWKSIEVHRELMAWLERLLQGNDWLDCGHKPGWILEELLEPFFVTGVEENWSTGRTMHLRSLPIHVQNTTSLRDRVLDLCRSIVARRSTPLTLAVIDVLKHGMARAWMIRRQPPASLQKEWEPERRKALVVLGDIIRDHPVPIIHFRARQVLRGLAHHEGATGFAKSCRQLLRKMPDNIESQVLRATLGNYWEEADRSKKPLPEDFHKDAERKWDKFQATTARTVLAEWPATGALLDQLARWETELAPLGFQPNFRGLFLALTRIQPAHALALAADLITRPTHPHGELLDALIITPTAAKPEQRMALCERAITTGTDELVAGAIGCFMWWRREDALPPRGWELITAAAQNASPRVAAALIHFVWMNYAKASRADWELLASLPVAAAPEWLAGNLVGRAADLLKTPPLPPSELVGRLLAKLDRVRSLQNYNFEHALEAFAKHYPAQVFLMVWRRHQLQKSGTTALDLLPFDFDLTQFAAFRDDPEAAGVIHELENRLLNGPPLDHAERRILSIAVMQGETRETELLRLLAGASRPDQLKQLSEFARGWEAGVVILSCPNFTKCLLEKARGLGAETYAVVADPLLCLPGSRGYTNGEADEEGKALLLAAESMAHRHANDPTLGPFYTAVAARERASMEEMRKRFVASEEMFDD